MNVVRDTLDSCGKGLNIRTGLREAIQIDHLSPCPRVWTYISYSSFTDNPAVLKLQHYPMDFKHSDAMRSDRIFRTCLFLTQSLHVATSAL